MIKKNLTPLFYDEYFLKLFKQYENKYNYVEDPFKEFPDFENFKPEKLKNLENKFIDDVKIAMFYLVNF